VEGWLRSMPASFSSLLISFLRCAAHRRARAAGAIALGVAFGSSCGVDSDPLFKSTVPLDPATVRPGNLPSYPPVVGLPGTGGREGGPGEGTGLGTGTVGTAQQPQHDADAGTPDGGAPSADAGFDAGAECAQDSDCEDANGCTFDDCVQGSCQHTPASAGVTCGRTDNSCAADRCDGAGACVTRDLPAGSACGVASACGQPACSAGAVCQPRDAANGSACPGGSCSAGACVPGQRVGCPQQIATSVPFQMNWSSAGRPDLFQGECESNNTPDAAVVFVAPAAGRYRFEASGSPDSVLSLVRGACGQGNGAELACNDDIVQDSGGASRIDVTLTANQTLTVYVSEFGNRGTGSGVLRISAL
jgi:hypothetical protein